MVKTAARTVLKSVGLYEPVREMWLSMKRPEWWVIAQKRMAFREGLAPHGGMVFDIGANVGEYAGDFLRQGRRVISVEPNPHCAGELRVRLGKNPRFKVVEAAIGPKEGSIMLHLADASAISSCSPEWIEKVRASGRFDGHGWNEAIEVEMTTLDKLIAEHGRPTHTKIDVEGFELEALKGLTQYAGTISLEFTPECIERTVEALDRLMALGYREFNYSYHETWEWALPRWVNGAEITREMRARAGDGKATGGDVFGR